MKAPINWLKKYVDIDLNNIDDLLHKLTLSGTEVDSVQRQGNWEGIVVGEVLEVSKHPKTVGAQLPSSVLAPGLKLKKL